MAVFCIVPAFAAEALEDALAFVGGDAGPPVAYGDGYGLLVAGKLYVDAAVGGREGEGVVDKVREGHLDEVAAAVDENFVETRGDREVDAAFTAAFGAVSKRRFKFCAAHRAVCFFEEGQGPQPAYCGIHALACARDCPGALAGVVLLVLAQELGLGLYTGYGVAQLVGCVCGKAGVMLSTYKSLTSELVLGLKFSSISFRISSTPICALFPTL